MRGTHRTLRFIAGSVLLSGLGGAAVAEDWPQWRGATGDAKVTGFTAPAAWPKELKQKWKATVGSGDSTPALVGDKLYVFSRRGPNETTLCLDAADGKEVWKDEYPAPAVTGAAGRHPGPRGSPAVADGKVVTNGVAGTVSCLDAATGKVVWRKDDFKGAHPQFFAANSPLVVDGMAVVQVGGPKNGAVIAYDLATGDPKWKWAGDGPGYSSLAVLTADGAKQVVTETEQNVVGLAAADGKLLWQVPFVGRGMGGTNAPTPIIRGQTVYFTGQGRGMKAVKIEKGGDAYAAKELWSNAELGTQYNTPVLKDGALFGLSDKGNLFCVDATTGKTAWTDKTRYSAFGEIVDAGQVLVVLTEKADLIVLRPDAKTYTEVAKLKAGEAATYAYPVLSGNRIVVRDVDSVTMWTTE